MTKVMGSTTGGDEVGQARGQTVTRVADQPKPMVGRPLIVAVFGEPWREGFLEPRG
jgi:hypothetical protein